VQVLEGHDHRFGTAVPLPVRFADIAHEDFFDNVLAVAHDYPHVEAEVTALLIDQPDITSAMLAVSDLQRAHTDDDRAWTTVSHISSSTRITPPVRPSSRCGRLCMS
jgi:hypothetical protein